MSPDANENPLRLHKSRRRLYERFASLVRDRQTASHLYAEAVAALDHDLGTSIVAVVEPRSGASALVHAHRAKRSGAILFAQIDEVAPADLRGETAARRLHTETPEGPLMALVCNFDAGQGGLTLVAAWPADEALDLDAVDHVESVAEALGRATRHAKDLLALDEARALAGETLAEIPAVVYTRDADGRPTFVSPRVEQLLGRPPQEWIDDPELWARSIHPEDHAHAVAKLEEQMQSGTPLELEYRMFARDGRVVWLRDTAVTIYASDGSIDHVQGVAADITRIKEFERELGEQERKLAAVVTASPVVVLAVNADGLIDFVSGAAETISGRSVVGLVGAPASSHIHPDDVSAMTTDWADLMAGKRSQAEGVIRYRHIDAHWLTLDCRSEVLLDEDDVPIGVVYAMMDVSEATRLAGALEEARDEAIRANEAKNDFLSRMSHEFRTPLNAILGFGQLLQLSGLAESDQESVEQVLRAGDHLLSLIDEVLDISRVEGGHIEVNVEPVDLRAVMREVVDLTRPQARSAGLTITMGTGLAGGAMADRQRLKQVLLNLMSNAIKYNAPGGHIELRCEHVADRVRLHVIDDGPGIAPDMLHRVFLAFDRLGAESTVVEGTGLGLALSHGITEAMGGVLSVTSTLGEGADFWVDLQATVVPEPPARSTRATDSPLSDRQLRGRVLYVEDNLSNQRLVQRLLSRFPEIHLTVEAAGGTGLATATQNPPDLILLDLNLPDISGANVLAQLLADQRTCDVPVIILSADATERQRTRLLEAGARGYLTKPLEVNKLLATLRDTLSP